MATGREIKQIYDSIKRICRETSQMLTVIHDNFGRQGFGIATKNSSVMWGTSTSYSSPDYWLPYFQQMLFAPRVESNPNRAVGVNVLFDDPDPVGDLGNVIPFVSCGVLSWKNGSCAQRSDEFYGAGWHPEDPGNTSFTPPLYHTVYENKDCREITFYLLPLDVINSEDAVVSLVVEPLLSLYRGEHETVISRVKNVAISMEQVKETPIVR
jgi:hypothetical protein